MRKKLEQSIVYITSSIYKHPFITILLLATILFFPLSHTSKITHDASIEGFLKSSDRDLLNHNEFRRLFGQDSEIIIAIQSSDIYTLNFLKRLKQLHLDLVENVPYIEDITSMLNARDSRGDSSYFKVENLLDPMPQNTDDLVELKQRVKTNRIFENLLISSDGQTTTIRIKPLRYTLSTQEDQDEEEQFSHEFDNQYLLYQNTRTDFLTTQELSEMVNAVQNVVSKYNTRDFKISVSGSPVASGEIVHLMSKDMPNYTRICLLTIFLLLLLFTRKLSYFLIPISVVALTLFTTFGLMAISGTAIKPPTQVLLSIIIVAGLCGTIHILTVFHQQLRKSGNKQAALFYSIEHCSIAVIFTSITTAMGLLSFAWSPLSPISDLGVFGAISVSFSLMLTFLVTILAVRLFPFRKTWFSKFRRPSSDPNKNVNNIGFIGRGMVFLGLFSHRHPLTVILFSVSLTLAAAAGISLLKFSHNSLEWLPKDNQVRIDTETIDAALHGSISMEVVIDTGREYGIQNKQLLNDIDDLTQQIYQLQKNELSIGKSVSVTDILREVNKTIHGNDKNYYKIPNQNLIDEEFLLFENSGSDDLQYYTDTLYRKARFTIKLPWLEASKYQQFIIDTKKLFDEKLGTDVAITPTGLMTLLAKTSAGVMHSMSFSYLYSAIIILLLMVWVNGNVKRGLVSMIPNLLPIVTVLGLMGFLKIPLDTFSIMVGSIALGLIVDDTIHFFHNFHKFYDETSNVSSSIQKTVLLTGRPILLTSLVLLVGFIMYTLSSMNNIQGFGIIMSVAIVLALFADLFLSPALVTILYKYANANALSHTEIQPELCKEAQT